MSDQQKFLVTIDPGASIVTPDFLRDSFGIGASSLIRTITVYEEPGEQDTILPWRVMRDGRTVAAVEDSTKALAVLEELADDLTMWRLEFHTAAI